MRTATHVIRLGLATVRSAHVVIASLHLRFQERLHSLAIYEHLILSDQDSTLFTDEYEDRRSKTAASAVFVFISARETLNPKP